MCVCVHTHVYDQWMQNNFETQFKSTHTPRHTDTHTNTHREREPIKKYKKGMGR